MKVLKIALPMKNKNNASSTVQQIKKKLKIKKKPGVKSKKKKCFLKFFFCLGLHTHPTTKHKTLLSNTYKMLPGID